MRPARRRQHDHRLLRAGNRFYAPPPPPPDYVALAGAPRPAWLRLGAGFVEQGTAGPVLFVISIRPTAAGGWELMGHRTCNRWYDTGEVTPL